MSSASPSPFQLRMLTDKVVCRKDGYTNVDGPRGADTLGRYSIIDLRALRDSMGVQRTDLIQERRDAAMQAVRQMLREYDSIAPSVPAATATVAACTLPRLQASAAPVTIFAPNVNPPTTEQASGNTTVTTRHASPTRPNGPLAPPPTSTSATLHAPIALRYIRDKDGISVRGPAFIPNRLARTLMWDILNNVEKLPPWSVRLRFDVMLMSWKMGRGLPWGNSAVDMEAGEYWARLERHLFVHGGRAESFVPEEAAGG
ncbi:hypothetical protein LTR95_011719 [Oleoguttula sp. CCFEE 5521]